MFKKLDFLRVFALFYCVFLLTLSYSYAQDHIQKLNSVQNNIISQGQMLPEIIKKTNEKEVRTIERVYELNTSALTTIAAYFRMLKVITASEVELTEQIINSLNEWLSFINNQCNFDLDYLNEAYTTSSNPEILAEITYAQKNLQTLSEITNEGIQDNLKLLEE